MAFSRLRRPQDRSDSPGVSASTRATLLYRLRDPDDAESWRQFESIYGDLIMRFCRRRGLQFADAEDIRQIVLTKLSRSLRRFEYDPSRGRFRDYLGQCLRNTIITESRRHKPHDAAVFLNEDHDCPIRLEQDEDDWNEEWIAHHYRRAIKSLRRVCDKKSLLVFDRILEGSSYEAIASEFGVTQESVRKIKQRVRDRLRAIIAAQVQDEEAPGAESRYSHD